MIGIINFKTVNYMFKCSVSRDSYGFTAVTAASSRDFKTSKGAIRWIERHLNDVIPDAIKQQIESL